MITLSRKPGETIMIGENIKITIASINQNTGIVTLGIEAPTNLSICREEKYTLLQEGLQNLKEKDSCKSL